MSPQKGRNIRFKGGEFQNRYKITGTLETISPLHIGDGDMREDENRLHLVVKDDEKKEKVKKRLKKDDLSLKYSTVMIDAKQSAYIPGTTIKGNLRSWVERIFTHSSLGLAETNDSERVRELYDIVEKIDIPGDGGASRELLTSKLKINEYLFGSGANEGKLEIWDAPMVKKPRKAADQKPFDICGYDPSRGTILLKSVAINPVTGTAEKKKLYNYEVVPEGARFELTVAGQNLEEDELGMLLFALYGFNSQIYPVTLGAMGGVGFGRFVFKLDKVHCLDKKNFNAWVKSALQTGHAGYTDIPELGEEECRQKIQSFKHSFLETMEKGQEGA